MPGVGVQVLPRHPPAGLLEDVQVVAVRPLGPEEVGQRHFLVRRDGQQLAAEHPPGVVGVVLRVAPGGEIEDHARPPLLPLAGLGELQPELRLADARCAHHHGQRARQQAAAHQPVQAVNARGKPSRGCHRENFCE